jgi:hypothetical protein
VLGARLCSAMRVTPCSSSLRTSVVCCLSPGQFIVATARAPRHNLDETGPALAAWSSGSQRHPPRAEPLCGIAPPGSLAARIQGEEKPSPLTSGHTRHHSTCLGHRAHMASSSPMPSATTRPTRGPGAWGATRARARGLPRTQTPPGRARPAQCTRAARRVNMAARSLPRP